TKTAPNTEPDTEPDEETKTAPDAETGSAQVAAAELPDLGAAEADAPRGRDEPRRRRPGRQRREPRAERPPPREEAPPPPVEDGAGAEPEVSAGELNRLFSEVGDLLDRLAKERGGPTADALSREYFAIPIGTAQVNVKQRK